MLGKKFQVEDTFSLVWHKVKSMMQQMRTEQTRKSLVVWHVNRDITKRILYQMQNG